MIDLNTLTLYKNKISSYLDKNALSISTKSNILNMFKIKNYTGNGIKINGNVKIDENGIATLFTTITDYIKTNLKALDVMNSTEFQIKFKTAHKLNRLISSIPLFYGGYTVLRLECVSDHSQDYAVTYNCNPSTYNNTFTYFFKTPFDIAKYYNQWLYIKVINNNNNRTLTLSTENELILTLTSNVKGTVTENQDIILGNNGNPDISTPNLQIDLSETYFKNGDTIISEWNI